MNAEKFDKARQDAVNQFVDSIPEGVLKEIGPLASIERQLHLGTDALGERITPEARQVLIHTRDHLKGKIMETHGLKSGLELNDYLGQFRMNVRDIKAEIANRAK